MLLGQSDRETIDIGPDAISVMSNQMRLNSNPVLHSRQREPHGSDNFGRKPFG